MRWLRLVHCQMRKRRFGIGDTVRNHVTKEQGIIVRMYSDLTPAEGKKAKMAYVVRLLGKEVLWHESEIGIGTPEPHIARATGHA